MAYIPPGAIKVYNNIKSIVSEHFSDRTKTPYVTVDKWYGKVRVTIHGETGKPKTHNIPIGEVDKLKEIYDILHQMAFGRQK